MSTAGFKAGLRSEEPPGVQIGLQGAPLLRVRREAEGREAASALVGHVAGNEDAGIPGCKTLSEVLEETGAQGEVEGPRMETSLRALGSEAMARILWVRGTPRRVEGLGIGGPLGPN